MSQETASAPRPRGRPPSKAARRKALNAARDILLQDGFGKLSIEAVTARSGVGKPTIYRNWANASELAMAALIIDADEAEPDTSRPLAQALAAQLRRLVDVFAAGRGRQIALTLAACDPESEMTKAFRNRVILTSRTHGRHLLEAAQQRKEIPPVPDVDVVLDMIYAPLFYRLLVGHAPLDHALADMLARRAGDMLTP